MWLPITSGWARPKATVAAGEVTVPIHRRYDLDDIAQAHAEMEAGNATGKLVVTLEKTKS